MAQACDIVRFRFMVCRRSLDLGDRAVCKEVNPEGLMGTAARDGICSRRMVEPWRLQSIQIVRSRTCRAPGSSHRATSSEFYVFCVTNRIDGRIDVAVQLDLTSIV